MSQHQVGPYRVSVSVVSGTDSPHGPVVYAARVVGGRYRTLIRYGPTAAAAISELLNAQNALYIADNVNDCWS